ncbi:hypothetical protein Tco_1092053 [Tanacetum coccineum]|uniref:Uncharacterized protein n=1 Tax=Tanacetum coccineum TaxID=301880 RepID=A0ABQ5I912_9ASTR
MESLRRRASTWSILTNDNDDISHLFSVGNKHGTDGTVGVADLVEPHVERHGQGPSRRSFEKTRDGVGVERLLDWCASSKSTVGSQADAIVSWGTVKNAQSLVNVSKLDHFIGVCWVGVYDDDGGGGGGGGISSCDADMFSFDAERFKTGFYCSSYSEFLTGSDTTCESLRNRSIQPIKDDSQDV